MPRSIEQTADGKHAPDSGQCIIQAPHGPPMKAQRPHPPHFPGDHHVEWRDHTVPYLIVAALILLTITLVIWLVDPAPPKTITISAGSRDSSFFVAANQYKKILARNGVRLNVLESDG